MNLIYQGSYNKIRKKEKKMEYYAKSPTLVLSKEKRESILEKLEDVISVLSENERTEEEYILLQEYKKNLLMKKSQQEHKTLREHLEETVQCAEKFFQLYGSYFSEKEKRLIILACKYHDIGKANYIFQTKVNTRLKKEKIKEIPHGFLSAMVLSQKKFLEENSEYTIEDFCILLTAIYYHHNRPDIYKEKEIKVYSEQFYLPYIREHLKNNDIEIKIGNKRSLLFSNQKENTYQDIEEEIWCKYMLVKGMLNKFDWTVSSGYESAELSTDVFEKKLCRNIEKKLSGNFRPVQNFMIENKNQSVVIIAPTGSGKTEAALLWIDGEKGFYTLPLKVSSNAIYKRIQENYQYKEVALLHSDSLNSYMQDTDKSLEDHYKKYEQAKLFSYPLTVCTVDQLFQFVYKALGTEIFAATLKYSKIVIDEIQSYSPRVVAALIFGLSEIKRMGGKFAVMTATFPPVLQYFMRKNKLLEGRDYNYHNFSDNVSEVRHRIKIVEDDFNIEEIIHKAEKKKILIICNTVSRAQKVYTEIKDRCIEAGLLHSCFIRSHRMILEKRIMDFSSDNTKTGVWVTTQIVEASLDIDFDILYTEMCTADSLLQRMGRCNRAGRKSIEQSNIIICFNGSGRGSIYDKDLYDRSANLIKKREGELFSEPDKVAYINEVYEIEQIKKTEYFRQIERNIECFKDLGPAEYNAEEAREEFRAIQSITVIPDKIYEQNESLIQSMKELLATPYVDKSIRKLLKSKFMDITLSLNVNCGIPKGIDKNSIGLFCIHRTRLDYDFDGDRGLGLLLDKMEDETYFI